MQRAGFFIGSIAGRREKYWGIIYDKTASDPIPFARVQLVEEGQVIDSAVSDLDGRYGFAILPAGQYNIEVTAGGYEDYSRTVKPNVTGEVLYNIPMSPLDESFGWYKRNLFYNLRDIIFGLNYVVLFLMLVGFLFTVYVISLSPSTVNYIILSLYLVLFILNLYILARRLSKPIGQVVDAETDQLIFSAVVSLYDDNGQQVALQLTNKTGVVKFNVAPGEYTMRVQKEGYKSNVDGVIEIPRSGYLPVDITMSKV